MPDKRIPCFDSTTVLGKKFDALYKEGMSEKEQREIGVEIALGEHKKLFEELNTFKEKYLKIKLTKEQKTYVSPDKTKEIQAIHDRYAQKIASEKLKQIGGDDLTLPKIEKDANDIITGKKVFERFSPEEQRGFAEGGANHVEASLILGADEKASRLDNPDTERQESLIQSYAEAKGIWTENTTQELTKKLDKPPFKSGEEASVWRSEDGTKVIKSQSTDMYGGNLQQKLDGITLHNTISEAPLKVIGFGRDAEGNFQVIVEQPFIHADPKINNIHDKDAVAEKTKIKNEYVKKLGFKEDESGNLTNGEVILEDLHNGNVIIDKDKNVIIIDPIMRLNTPEQGYGGTRIIKNEINDNTKEPIKGNESLPPKTEKPVDEKPDSDSGEAKEGSGEPPSEKEAVGEGSDGKKELDKLANNVPDSGEVAKYMSKDTIEKYTGEEPTNDQTRGVQELEIALNHGEKIIEKAKEVFGKDYVEKTLDYIDQSTAAVSNKALMYVSLENALGREKLQEPTRAAELTKQQALVYTQSQKFARENSLALNYQKLRKIATAGYDIEKVTDNFFSADELVAKNDLKKAIEADPDAINKEAELQEAGGMTPEIEKLVQEGIDKEITKIYEAMPKEKKQWVDRSIKALEAVQKKLRSRTYDATLGIPVYIVDVGITTIKRAIKLTGNIQYAVEAGIANIKELLSKEKGWDGKEWENEDKFRKDALEEFDKQLPNTKKIVKEALIEKGFGTEITIKGEKKKILDWKKLAGAAGTVEKIKENVESVMKGKGKTDKEISDMAKDLNDEYVSLRESIINKAQNELARRNKESVTPQQKSAAKKLSELYTYGLFEAKADEFENTLNKALGAKVSEKGFNEAKEIAKALETIYTNTFKGVRLNDISAKAAIEKLEDRLRILLFREAKSQGNTMLKLANVVRNYFEIQQTMILNNLKQAVENPFSGLQQSVIESITGTATTKEMASARRKFMKDVYKDMVLSGGIGYGKVESTFVNRQHIDDYVNKLSDNKLYHGIASVVTGKATLNAMDAMYKASITEQKFTKNLIKILTHETNPNRLSKEDAVKFVSEKLTGQSFKDAQATAKQVIEKINKDAGSELLPTNQQAVDRFANDIVKAALEMGGKITKEQIESAYGAAYKAAGLGLGHEANNILSSTIKGYSAKLEGEINLAIKNKEWNRAAMLTYKSILFRNVLNPFVGGGTNWLVLKFEKAGLGLFTGLMYNIGSKGGIDVGTELGMKRLESRLYNQSRIKDNYMRGLVGGVTSLLTYAAFLGVADEEEYRKWREKNRWAARYLDLITPEHLLAEMAVKDNKVKQYAATSFNRNDAFDATTKLIKAVEYAAKGDKSKAWGALGEAVGGKLNAPVPWRLVKDGKVIYQGARGEDPWHGNYKPSEGFLSGALQGGVVEWLGYRPIGESKSQGNTITLKGKNSKGEYEERQATPEEYKDFNELKEKMFTDEMKRLEGEWIEIDPYGHVSVTRKKDSNGKSKEAFKRVKDGDSKEFKDLTDDQNKELVEKIKAQMRRKAVAKKFGEYKEAGVEEDDE